MTNQLERKYVSDFESYAVFVGQITPQEFVAPFDGDLSRAIDNLETGVYDEPIPSWLKGAITRYVEEKLAE